MASIEVSGRTLVIHIQGVDRLLALESRIAVPLEHVARVEPNPPEAHDAWHGVRMGGTNVPGVITAGHFVQDGEWSFWDVHDPNKAIAVYLRDDSYARLVIGVDDPGETLARVRAALGGKQSGPTN